MATVNKIISILKRFYHRPNSLGFNLYFQLAFNAFLMDLPNSFFIHYRTAIKRTFALVKENRYRMEISNRYKGFENVTIHAIEHDIA
jgi:hypothetical protein